MKDYKKGMLKNHHKIRPIKTIKERLGPISENQAQMFDKITDFALEQFSAKPFANMDQLGRVEPSEDDVNSWINGENLSVKSFEWKNSNQICT